MSAQAVPIAVIGLSCRLPGAATPEEFWRLLAEGRGAVGDIPAERLEARFRTSTAEVPAGARRGGFLDDVTGFDAGFFGVAPRAAAAMDPQQRLALELAWEALEDARVLPATLRGRRAAVFIGAIADDYATLLATRGSASVTSHSMAGVQRGMIANRVSYALGLRGPSLTVDSGQSSSLVAVHMACESLRTGESELALVGGVHLNLAVDVAARAQAFGGLSPDGRCFTFDARANGFVRGEGGGIVVLKPLARALADNDPVRAVILGTAVNNDGGGEHLTAPDPVAQQEVLRSAWRSAGVGADDLGYVELHGTGTAVGDPVEAAALGAARSGATTTVPVGSVKTNIGHLEGAAGIAGLIKTVLSVGHGLLPKSRNFRSPNPAIPLEELNLRVLRAAEPWPGGRPRVAGVSAFGMGGTNCHVVVCDHRRPTAPDTADVPGPWVLSGRDGKALAAQASRLAGHVRDTGGLRPGDVGLSLATTRTAFDHRAVVTADDVDGMLAGLDALACGEQSALVRTGIAAAPRRVAFVFSGQGGQWPGMAVDLIDSDETFRAAMRRCADALAVHTGWDVISVLRGAPGAPGIESVDVVQPVLFAVAVSLAELWQAHGVRPAAVIGHSQGEIAAAHVAGALSLEEAARVVSVRSRLAAELLAGQGALASVVMAADELRPRLERRPGRLWLSVINGPGSVVVSGQAAAIDELVEELTAQDVRAQRIPAAFASHSPMVEPLREPLLAELGTLTPVSGQVPFYAGVTGGRFDTDALDGAYWYRNLREPVRFQQATQAALADGIDTFIEVSPHPVMAVPMQQTAQAAGHDATVLATLRRDEGGPARWHAALGAAHVHGVEIDWRALWAGGATTVALPGYAFQRRPHWLHGDPTAPVESPATGTGPQAAPAAPDAGVTGGGRRRITERLVASTVAAALGHDGPDAVPAHRTFRELGVDSAIATEIGARLTAATGLPVPATLLYDHPTSQRLADHLAGTPDAHPGPAGQARGTTSQDDPIAIVAMSCRLPGDVRSPEDLWRLLADSRDAIGGFPDDRGWNIAELYDPDPERSGRSSTDRGGFLYDAGEFDAALFGISPREALAMDPQQRLLLETSWEAFERAGIAAGSLRGTKTGVFVGVMDQRYGPRWNEEADGLEGFLLTGNAASVNAGRIAYAFGLEGPTIAMDTACSSSLVALHLAVRALRSGECSMALAGGVTVMSTPEIFIEFSRQRGLAADGRCKAFSADADGTGWSEGVAMLLVERLSDARRLGHPVLALVRGSAINSDGASNGLTAPSGTAQRALVRQALADAGLLPSEVDAVEAHGTGTALGDPIEASALLDAYGGDRERPLLIGSLKSNIGHTQAAAGAAGVIKMVCALQAGRLPRTLHIEAPTPAVDWTRGSARLLTETTEWPAGPRPRRAGVSSFGISGTNAHVIIEEAPPAPEAVPAAAEEPAPRPFLLSGHTPAALRAQAARLRDHLGADDTIPLPDLARSLATTRAHLDQRAAVIAADRDELLDGLDGLARGRTPHNAVTGLARPRSGVVFVFSGQGGQWQGMAVDLLDTAPVFRARMTECAQALRPLVGWDLFSVVRAEPGAPSIADTEVLQPVLFSIVVSLAELWRSYGVEPEAVVGHSQGEVAAACVAGALSLEDAARVIVVRSRLAAEGLDDTGIVSVAMSADDLSPRLARWEGRIWLSVINGPASVAVSGEGPALEELIAELSAEGVKARRIPAAFASHSPAVEVLREPLLTRLEGLRPRSCGLPFYSSVAVEAVDTAGLDPEYWYGNLRHLVRFADVTELLISEGYRVFVEISPHPVLTPAIEAIAEKAGVDVLANGTLRRDEGDLRKFLAALSRLHTNGFALDITAVLGSGGVRVALPTYEFQRSHYWLTGGDSRARRGVAIPQRPHAGRPAAPQDLVEVVRAQVADVLRMADVDDVDPGKAFKELGLDSLTALELRNRLTAATGVTVPVTAIFSHPTVHDLARHLGGAEPDAVSAPPAAVSGEPIAIVGMACRFPGGVGSPEQLWDLLQRGADAITGLPTDRGWDLDRLPESVRHGGFIHDAAEFDAGFFGISPREALAMDPQQRLLLETSWEALERAGIDATTLRGDRVGVFVGAVAQDYGPRLHESSPDQEGHLLTGTISAVASGRIAYVLGLEGPAITVDTACSSSLVALHLAAQSLSLGECSLALAGGATVMANPGVFVEFARQRGLAADGRCKAFSVGADGTGWSEGAGMLVLERLSDARRLGHRVLAVVRGSAVNSDGASNGLTAPNGLAQQRVIRAALANAGLAASDVDLVEAHGTGTALGDPIEADALLATYGRDRDRPLWLGSLKSNIGHTQAAAGVAGVIKSVMALRHGVLPRTLHAENPSPHVDWSSGAVSLLTSPVEWPDPGRPRRAGVSAFGVSGTNAHVVLESAEETEEAPVEPTPDSKPVPVVLSGRTPQALADQIRRLRDFAESGVNVRDLAWSLATARTAFEYRAAFVASTRQDLLSGLDNAHGVKVTGGRLAVLFAGQGSQRAGMGCELAGVFPVFAEAFGAVVQAFDEVTGQTWAEGDLSRTEFAQPALFAFEVALYRLLESWGLRPDVVMGHSLGEITAAHVAGVFSLRDACLVVAERARLMQALEPGAMVALPVPEDQVVPLLAGRVSIAAVNGPQSVVVSGAEDDVLAVASRFERWRRLPVGHAFHSPLTEPMLEDFHRVMERVEFHPPRLTLISNVTGQTATPEQVCTAGYWVEHVRATVRFADGVKASNASVLCEIGPDGVLSGLTGAIPTQRPDRPQVESLLAAAGELFVRGVHIDWRQMLGEGNVVDLPTYAFQHERYWLESGHRTTESTDDLRYHPTWERLDDQPPAEIGGPWLLIAPVGFERHDLVRACATRLGSGTVELFVGADDDRASIARRLREIPVPAGVFSLLALDAALHPAHPGLAVGGALTHLLVQALGDAEVEAPLWFGTCGAVAVGDEPLGAVEQCGVWALGRVVALEHPLRWGGLVDLPATFDDRTARRFTAVLGGGEDQVAIRADGVYGRRIVRTVKSGAGKNGAARGAWRPRGTALITGGTGGLGAQVARWLARNGTERLLLVSRSGPEAPGAGELLAELAELGAAAEAVACDVTDYAALETVVRQAREQGAEFRTVVHAAGLAQQTPIADLDLLEFARITAAKVIGAVVLDQLFDDDSLDAFVLFSSIAGVWGSGGQSAYAAANAFLDGLATLRRAAGVHAVSIAWGPWAGRGMGEDNDLADYLRRRGLRGLRPDVALRAMREAVEGGGSEVTVADVDWDRFLQAFTSARPSPLLAAFAPVPARAGEDDVRGELGELRALSGADRTARLRSLVRGQVAAALGHGSEQAIDVETPFSELGMDSLAAVDLRNALSSRTGVPLPVTVVFERPSVLTLADHLSELLGGDDARTARETAEDAEIRALLAGLPISRLREAGLLDRLLGLAAGDALGAAPQDDDIDTMDLEDLVRAALDGKPL
ncbi:type I polyketide synthase [Streptosporangium sp. NPDC051022]|uniref:type I polyketide synthase n=1 Tax=Streptosporangium sp. NPDC051022 TaxID=3155752 RepID=UPI003444A3B5